jgi:hypothetical protein
MPKHYIDEEWDRDALFATRNLVSLDFAAEHLKVSPHAVEKAAARQHGPLLLWVYGGGGQTMRKYRQEYVDMGPRAGLDLAHAWQESTPEHLLGEARQQFAESEQARDHLARTREATSEARS